MTFRLHFTCKAGHISYIDFKTLKSALNNIKGSLKLGSDWYWFKLEVL